MRYCCANVHGMKGMSSRSPRDLLPSWLLCLAILLLPTTSGALPVAVSVTIGINKFDLLKQYSGATARQNAGVISNGVVLELAGKALDDARDIGVELVRVSVSGYGPSVPGEPGDLDLWRTAPATFWARVDAMMEDLDSRGMRLVPTFLWNVAQFPAMAKEKTSDLIRNPDSASWRLLSEYVSDFIIRYRNRKTILFYELTNELNLGVDLDHHTCSVGPAHCAVLGNYTTDDMNAFIHRFALLVRKLDNSHPISSGFATPRAAAEHIRAYPAWKKHGPDWTRDTREQFIKHLKDIHQSVDIVSIHVYDDASNRRFGSSDAADLVDVAKQAADEVGKPLFVGEFGESDPTKATDTGFSSRILRKLVELRVPYSAVWVWERYMTNPFQRFPNSLEPGFTNFVNTRIQEINLGKSHAIRAARTRDSTAPRLVLVSPADCSEPTGKQVVAAVASDNSGKVSHVEFWLKGRRIDSDFSPPYQAEFNADLLQPGKYRLEASAFDRAGNKASAFVQILVQMKSKGNSCRSQRGAE